MAAQREAIDLRHALHPASALRTHLLGERAQLFHGQHLQQHRMAQVRAIVVPFLGEETAPDRAAARLVSGNPSQTASYAAGTSVSASACS